jgi:hypothetical protein
VEERIRAGADDDPFCREGPDVLERNLLVVEGQHVAAGREGAQVVQGLLVRDRGGRYDLGRSLVRGARQHREPHAEGDRCGLGHPRQLAATDHADDRPVAVTRHG